MKVRSEGTEITSTDLFGSWQPIDTAPKDGTRVLLCFIEPSIGADYEVGIYVPNHGYPVWRAAGTFVEPVAWMPIPNMPNAKLSHEEGGKEQL